VCAERHGELDGDAPDAARAALDEDVLAGAQVTGVDQVGPGGADGLGEGGGVDEADPGGHGERLRRADDGLLGVTAALEQADDLVADPPVGHPRTEAPNRTRNLEPGPRRGARRRGVVSGPL
jgi:hypothetical protein